MQTLLVWSLLAQVQVAPVTSPLEPVPFTWSDGQRSYKLWESPVLIAEPSPTPARRDALLALEAVVVIDRPTMRVWKVRDLTAVKTRFPELRPVFHDNRAGVGRYRVPLGLVCAGQRREAPWREVLEGSSGVCLPDFWYPPVLK